MAKKFEIGKIIAKGSILILNLEGDNGTPFEDTIVKKKRRENKNGKEKRKRKK